MKTLTIAVFLLLTQYVACQNGPTAPSVQLAWVQSSSAGVTGNCIYRGLTAGNYALPALFCSVTPITTYVDNTVARGTTYHFAITAQAGGVESGYSNDAVAVIPVAPAPPTNNAPAKITQLDGTPDKVVAKVIWR